MAIMTFTPSEHIQTILKNLPMKPGVYLMKDERGKIIYVGKAKRLRNRVRSYFNSSAESNLKTMKLRENIRDIDFIVEQNEIKALILEETLIKRYQPHYNISLKDDKNYPYIRVELARPVPESRDDPPDGQRRQPLFRSLRGDVGGAEHAANAAQSLPLPDLRPRDHRERSAPVPVLRHQAVQRALHRRGQSGSSIAP